MVDTPTMSLRVPHNADMRRALREAAKALRHGQVSAEALIAWLASRTAAGHGLPERLDVIEQRLATLEAAVAQLRAPSNEGLYASHR